MGVNFALGKIYAAAAAASKAACAPPDLNLLSINLRAGTKAIVYVRQVWGKAVALLRFEPPITTASALPGRWVTVHSGDMGYTPPEREARSHDVGRALYERTAQAALALSAAKNLARNLATLCGTKRKKGLQGTCKVSFFGILWNRSERNSVAISVVWGGKSRRPPDRPFPC
jgi:hypothetical protein